MESRGTGWCPLVALLGWHTGGVAAGTATEEAGGGEERREENSFMRTKCQTHQKQRTDVFLQPPFQMWDERLVHQACSWGILLVVKDLIFVVVVLMSS